MDEHPKMWVMLFFEELLDFLQLGYQIALTAAEDGSGVVVELWRASGPGAWDSVNRTPAKNMTDLFSVLHSMVADHVDG